MRKKYIWQSWSNIEGFDGSCALSDKMLLVRIIENNKINYLSLSKVVLG